MDQQFHSIKMACIGVNRSSRKDEDCNKGKSGFFQNDFKGRYITFMCINIRELDECR